MIASFSLLWQTKLYLIFVSTRLCETVQTLSSFIIQYCYLDTFISKRVIVMMVSTNWSLCLFLLVYLTWARKSTNRGFVKATPSQTGVYIERRNKHKLLHRIRSDWSLLIYDTVFPNLNATNYWISTQSHFGLKLGASNHCFKSYKGV
jgi:hypothetical protein